MAALAHKMAANMATGSSSSNNETSLQQQQQQQQQQHQQQQQQHQQQINGLMAASVIQPDYLLNNDRGLFKVYCFIKDFIGASGTSAVAIDNKIEQAMDLVKSHLMIAVREEVEVLKERISELMDKISNLELENNILKSNMSPETLQQLQMQLQIAGSQQPAAVAAPPATPAIQAAPTAATVTAAAAAATSTAAATSPATSAAPATILANGSAENGGSSVVVGVDAAVSVVDTVQQAATNGSSGVAPAVVSTNGPMS